MLFQVLKHWGIRIDIEEGTCPLSYRIDYTAVVRNSDFI